MKRSAYQKLVDWKNNPNRKPLIIQGARQVGKTWLMKDFGQNEYSQMAYFNFESSKELQGIFQLGFNTTQMVSGLSILAGFQITTKDTLLIFDEIQACPNAITSLKYFQENAAEYSIIAAGSLLGVAIHQGISFPVGKVEFLNLQPLNFEEFLYWMEKHDLLHALQNGDKEIIQIFSNQYIELLKQYFFVGGMPEVVKDFISNKDYQKVRRLQENILTAYEIDFSKHAPIAILARIRLVWQSLVGQLAKENSKFIYNNLRSGARAKDFELAIEWLKDAGLIHKVNRINKSGLPIQAYAQWTDFKIYFNDIGLLCAKAGVSPEIILQENNLFIEFKGIISEQFVLQQLLSEMQEPYYWNPETGIAELDFVIQKDNFIIPIEVKAANNLKSRSLRNYYDKYTPTHCLRISLAPYQKQDWMENIPLYGFHQWVKSKLQ